jgi:ATP-binding cassette subfamily B protein
MNKDNLRQLGKILRVLVGINKSFLLYPIGQGLFYGIAGFCAIMLPSRIMNMLVVQDGFSHIVVTVIVGSILVFVSTVLAEYFVKMDFVYNMRIWRVYFSKSSGKAMELDFAQLESPYVTALRQRMKDDDGWGASIGSVFHRFREFSIGFFQIVSAIMLLFPFLSNAAVLTTPVFYVGVVALTALAVAVYRVDTVILKKRKHKAQSDLSNVDALFHHYIYGNGFTYANGKDVRVYEAAEFIVHMLEKARQSIRNKIIRRIERVTGGSSGIKSMLYGIVQGGSYIIVLACAVNQVITPGELIRYAGGIFMFFKAMTTILHDFADVFLAAEHTKSAIEYFELPSDLRDGNREPEDISAHSIEFINVSFKYPGATDYALRNLSLKLKLGQILAVVGQNGSGKTTMVKLLCRLYDPTEGKITLDGVDIREYSYDEYLKMFSVVFQDFRLFSFSLGQNVAASLDYNPSKVQNAFEKAGFSMRASELPQGLDTPLYQQGIQGGVEISGGEAQKIALARAIYKDAPFVVLDEPTAALDPIAEYDMYSRFNEIIGGKTAIYISHRLSSCRFCDDIIVLDAGKLIQRGGHDELVMDEGGKYHELWNAQSKYYN